ncbi:MAG: hypothetical protein Kow0063_08690 [Anaerolineae bacterium]
MWFVLKGDILVRRPSIDTLLLFVLLLARVRIDTLAMWAAIPTDMLQADVARLVGGWWPASGLALLADRQTSDPVTLLLISLAFGLFLAYLLVDAFGERIGERVESGVKMGLVLGIILLLVFGQTALFIGLRHISGPAAYTHDGGVIQTEVTIEYLLAGVNPYVADYLDTPMALWGTEYRTALYHYPYLPWTFLFSAPFYLASHAAIGWFDQRLVYLLLFALTLALAQGLARRPVDRLGVVMVIGLNPTLASDVIFGQNDSFVLFWVVLALALLRLAETRGGEGFRLLSAAVLGLACASKPTAWFLVPFWAFYLLCDRWSGGWQAGGRWVVTLARRAWPLAVVFLIVVGPWFVWDPAAMFDDVWRWSAGTAEAPYQIRGWGLSNFVLAFSLVPDRLAYWPFWILELLIATPLLIASLWRQARHNTLAEMLYHYGLLLFGFFYVSRFLNENYLGYLLAIFALAYFSQE